MSIDWKRLIFLFLGCLSLSLAGAQDFNADIRPKDNSPYSRFGLGDPISQYFAGPTGMAGLSAAFNDPYHLNFLNPASFAHLQATAFEVGMYAKYASMKDANASQGVWSGNLNYLALGFPLKNQVNEALDRRRTPWQFGMGIGLIPYSLIGYDVEVGLEDPNIGPTTNSLKGNGGTYRVLWSNAVRYKSLSVGANLGYHFGKMINSRKVEFDSLSYAYSTEFQDDISVGGMIWSLGVQYTYDFKMVNEDGETVPSGKRLIFGAYGNSATTVNTFSNQFYFRNNFSYPDLDTIAYTQDIEREATLPAEFAVGLMYERINKVKIGFEYQSSLWSGYENEAKPDTGNELMDSWRAAVGVELIPDIISYNNYFRRMRYRFGAFYQTDPRNLNGDQLDSYGLSVGFGFPIIMPRQQTSFINLAIEGGRFGLSDGLHETFVRMTLGFTLNDNSWFFKRKFN